MNDTEKLQGNNDITVIITDYEEPCRPRRSGNKPERPRLPVSAKLIALWNLLFELIVGVPFIGFMSLFGDDGSAVIICGLIFACVHTAISAATFKQHYSKNGVPAWKFVLLNALPLFLISAFIFVISLLMIHVFVLDFGLLLGVFSVCFGGYSAVYGVLLAAVFGIRHLIEGRKA